MMKPKAASSISVARAAAWRKLRSLGNVRTAPLDEPREDGDATRRDRAQANRLVQGVLRNLSLLDAWLNRPKLFDPAKTPAAVLWILRLAAYEKIFQSSAPDYAIGEQAVELARQAGGARAAGFVNAIMRRLLPTLPDTPEAMKADPFWAGLPCAVRWSIPPAIVHALGYGYGHQDVEAIIAALSERESPIWLRVNTLKTAPEGLAAELAAEGAATASDAAAPPEALRWQGEAALPWASQPWGRGELTVQDVGAMLAAWLLDPAPGGRVLDFCAAPGGKTGHLWEKMEGRGTLVALEINPLRRRELREALERLYGADHGIAVPEDDQAAEHLEAGQFERVLVDAPCQALGLLRRHPEIRWDERLRRQSLMQQTQRLVLDGAARLVRPGGRLLWVTCSPTAAENEEIIIPWLENHKDWWILDPAPQLRPEWRGWLQLDKGVLRTRPDRMDCDGFAMILLERLGK